MSAVSYYLLLPLIYLISLSPKWLLYRISDFFYFIMFYILGYRRKVIYKNLKNSFPEKTEAELQVLVKEYYSYLCDLFLETIKTITMDESYVHKCVKFNNIELLNDLYDQGKSVILVMGHFGNWELAGPCFSLNCKHQLNVVYKPLSNKKFEALFSKTRTKFNTKIIPMSNTLRAMSANRKTIDATALIADQSPGNSSTGYWIPFLNQETLVFTGPEKMGKMFDYPIVYIQIQRMRRGFYEITPTLLFKNSKETADHEITNTFFKRLEEDIHQSPVTWLWSHRRWKYDRATETKTH